MSPFSQDQSSPRRRIGMNRYTALVLISLMAFVFLGCAAYAGRPDWWKNSEHLSDDIARASIKAVPYPKAVVQKGGFLERRNLAERLKRQADPNKIGYVYILSFGKFIGYYTIKGKISSTDSQMTNTNQTWDCGDSCTTVVDSVGDDGSFGPNEVGVFFFTQQGVMVQTNSEYVYSDQPLTIDVPNLTR